MRRAFFAMVIAVAVSRAALGCFLVNKCPDDQKEVCTESGPPKWEKNCACQKVEQAREPPPPRSPLPTGHVVESLGAPPGVTAADRDDHRVY